VNDAFVTRWIDDWNQKNLEAILAHCAPEIEFVSPKALQITGSATIHGKDALRNYWTSALQKINDLHFVLDHWTWDADKRELHIVYIARLNGSRTRTCEILRFGIDELVHYGEAMYGVPLNP
jgi:hypothetical protein